MNNSIAATSLSLIWQCHDCGESGDCAKAFFAHVWSMHVHVAALYVYNFT